LDASNAGRQPEILELTALPTAKTSPESILEWPVFKGIYVNHLNLVNSINLGDDSENNHHSQTVQAIELNR
jgi:hypothetical protein